MLSRLILAFTLFFALGTAANAGDFGTKEEAKALAERAAAHIETVGLEAAGQDFMVPGNEWHDRDLYVFIFGGDGMTLSHGAKPELAGKNLVELRDVDGKQIVKEMIAIEDTGWVEYKWQNPTTNAVDPKITYVIRVGDAVVGVGAYNQ